MNLVLLWQTTQEVIFVHLTPSEAFWIGCVGYPALELLYRKRTHPAVALAGGLSCFALTQLGRRKYSLLRTSIFGGCAITFIELVLGLTFNRRHHIWDYRHLPFNLQGQICLPFLLVWVALSSAYLKLFEGK